MPIVCKVSAGKNDAAFRFTANAAGNTYSWNVSAPQLPATPLSPLPSIMPGTVTPEMLASRQNNAADFASWIATQSTRLGSAATAYGAYLASQPNAVSQTGAAIQFGMAGTANVVGFGAGAMEQLLPPDARAFGFDSTVDLVNYYISEKFKLFGPITTEVGESMKGADWASSLKKGTRNEDSKNIYPRRKFFLMAQSRIYTNWNWNSFCQLKIF